MMRRLFEFVSPIALVVCIGALPEVGSAESGPKAERPDTKVGDKYTYACKEGIKTFDSQTVITSVDESRVKYTKDGAQLENTREGNIVKDERFTHTDYRTFSFPLEVGKTWTFGDQAERLDVSGKAAQKGKVTVVAYEKVRVLAGEFDAFKVQSTTDWIGTGGSGRIRGTYWYAPAARTSVKKIVDNSMDPEVTCELKEFQLQP